MEAGRASTGVLDQISLKAFSNPNMFTTHSNHSNRITRNSEAMHAFKFRVADTVRVLEVLIPKRFLINLSVVTDIVTELPRRLLDI